MQQKIVTEILENLCIVLKMWYLYTCQVITFGGDNFKSTAEISTGVKKAVIPLHLLIPCAAWAIC